MAKLFASVRAGTGAALANVKHPMEESFRRLTFIKAQDALDGEWEMGSIQARVLHPKRQAHANGG